MEKSLLISNYRRNTTSSFLNFYLSYKRNYLKGGFSLLYYFEYFWGVFTFFTFMDHYYFLQFRNFWVRSDLGPAKYFPIQVCQKRSQIIKNAVNWTISTWWCRVTARICQCCGPPGCGCSETFLPGDAGWQSESVNVAAHPDTGGVDRATRVNVALKKMWKIKPIL